MAAVLRMGQEEKESLMCSEAQRLRTYRVLWPANVAGITPEDLAKEGFYYTGKFRSEKGKRSLCTLGEHLFLKQYCTAVTVVVAVALCFSQH